VASMPLAMELVSRNAMEGPFMIRGRLRSPRRAVNRIPECGALRSALVVLQRLASE
jgi:hypothetical protein